MAKRFEVRKGFLRLQRLGPVKFGEQSRWSLRAPEATGLWAFPYPHFDLFYAYHRYMDILPKGLKGDYPKDLKWWRRKREKGEEPYAGVHEVPSEYERGDYPLERYGDLVWSDTVFHTPLNGYVISEYWTEQERWIEAVAKKVMPLREFWYRGELYAHFLPDGSVGDWTATADEEGNDWTLMDTDRFARFLRKPGNVVGYEGSGPDGKPSLVPYSKDHLEVFIPRGRGTIRDRI